MPRIDTTAIEGYAGMTAEEKLAALEAFEYEDHAAEASRNKAALDKASGEAAEWKRKHHALLDEDERKKTEATEREAQLQEQLAEANKTIAVSGYTSQLLANGYSADLAKSTAEAMASGDTETVFKNQQTFLAEHDKAVKAELLKQTPKPDVGNGGGEPGVEDLAKKAEEAMASGNRALASQYIREIAKRNAEAKN